MSIRYRFLAAIAVLAVTACSGGGAAVATPTPSPTPNDGVTTSLVTARYAGNLLYNQPIVLHSNTGTAAAPVVGPVLQTINTDPNTLPTGGQALFTGLTPLTSYCWTYDYVASPTVTVHAQACLSNWSNFTLGS